MSIPDRSFLLGASLLAAYQVTFGIEGMKPFTILCLTIGFGVIVVAGLLLIILGYEGLESSPVVVLSTLIPISLSTGLVSEYFPQATSAYLAFSCLGLVVVAGTRLLAPGYGATLVLACVHGVAGLIIFGLPIILSLQGVTAWGFMLVGVGGGLVSLAGLLLFSLRMQKPVLSRGRILAVFPGLLLLGTAAFVAGFTFATGI